MKTIRVTIDRPLVFLNGRSPVLSESGHYRVYGSNGPIGYSDEFNHEQAIILGRVGAYCGSVAICNEPFWASDNTIVVKPTGRQSLRYWYYQLLTLPLRNFAGGAAQPLLTHTILRGVEAVIFEDQHDQQRIADILSAYDDLIENNRRRMALLEEAARQLYREWFVRLRFPGHEHTRIIDGVPEGWERVPTPQAIEVNPTTYLSDESEHWWVEMADLPTDNMVIQRAKIRGGRSGSKFRNGDTIFARITPCLENGKTAFVHFMEDGEVGRGSTEFIVLRSKRVTPEYVYCLARTYGFRENAIKSMIGASGRQRVHESCFDKFMVLIPPTGMLRIFTDFVSPVFRQIKVLHRQDQQLRTARDLLLPRLMSGEIAV